MFVGLICIYLAYTFNSSNLYSISGKAYGTTWSVTSTEFIADHHEKKILDIIELANANDIALMLVTSKKGEIELLFSDKWYDFPYE